MLVASDVTCEPAMATGLKEDHRKVAAELDENVAKARHAAAAKDQRRMTTVLSPTDSRARAKTSCSSSRAREGLANRRRRRRRRRGVPRDARRLRSGGASNAAAALHVFSEKPWGIGVGHGLRPTTKPMRVSKAAGNVVQQVNGSRRIRHSTKPTPPSGV